MISMNGLREKRILERTYNHKMTVIRVGEYEDVDGITKFGESTVYSDVKCALSQTSKFNTTQGIKNDIKYTSKVFASPEFQIYAGDKISIQFENGLKRTHKAGESFIYPSHQEIPLLREEEA